MRDIWQRLAYNRLALASLGFIILLAILALAAPAVAPHDPEALTHIPYASPGPGHWLGADNQGRDILSRILFGARISLKVGLIAVSIALAAGTAIGIAAGYFGGKIDATLSRLTDVLLSFPDIFLALAIMAVLGASTTNIMLAIGIVYTPIFARIARAAAMQLRPQPFIEAARALGAGHLRILLRHILPNITVPLIVQTTLSFAFAILAEAALSFLGLGVEPGTPSWGIMLQDGKRYQHLAWWMAVFPGLAITLAVLSFNLLGDGLRDALDPRLHATGHQS